MATATMRHFNSPEERAKRAAQPPSDPSTRGNFKHWNSPEERAKRGELPAPAASTAVVPRPAKAAPAAPWPPPGQANNAPDAGPPVEARRAPEPTGTLAERVKTLETLVFTLVDNVGEARDLRRLLSNLQAVTDTQQDFGNRVLALEHTLEDLAEQLDAESQPEAPAAPEAGPEAPAAETPTTEGSQ